MSLTLILYFTFQPVHAYKILRLLNHSVFISHSLVFTLLQFLSFHTIPPPPQLHNSPPPPLPPLGPLNHMPARFSLLFLRYLPLQSHQRSINDLYLLIINKNINVHVKLALEIDTRGERCGF